MPEPQEGVANTKLYSQLFGESVLDVLLEGIGVNRNPYTTVVPTGSRDRSIRFATPLPQLRRTPYVRAVQPKRLHRYECARRAAGVDYCFTSLNAALQTYQGGFMAKAASLRLPDRDHLQKVNPVVYVHGTPTVGGKIQFGNFMPRDDVEMATVPVVRTDSTEQSIYNLLTDDELKEKREFTLIRQPYQNARVARDNKKPPMDVLSNLKEALEADEDRKAELAEVQKLINEEPNASQVDAWLKKKNEFLKKEAGRRGIPNVELRLALPGYTVIPPNTFFDHRVHGLSLTRMHAGLMFLAFYSRTPTLGGHVSRGCGAFMDCVYRVMVSDDQFAPPRFNCLFRVSPFKALAVCMEDLAVDEKTWQDVNKARWVAVEEAPDDCFVKQAIAAWNSRDPKQFDFNFVPRGTVTEEINGDDDTV